MDSSVLIYGANGYTGELIARTAKSRGYTPILAARREAALQPLAAELGLRQRSFSLDDPRAIDQGLRDIRVVLHCAGPFSSTSQPMAAACLRAGAHYLDV
ncbi:MAG TPA: saccharopine dehydrogenase NADP-binding domain-containing protein, partial [Polyangiales bacterium]